LSRHPRNVPADDPRPGETPPRRNPRTRLLNKARDEAGVYHAGAAHSDIDPGEINARRSAAKTKSLSRRLSAQVTGDTRDRLREIAAREGITLGELIERAIDAYERQVKPD